MLSTALLAATLCAAPQVPDLHEQFSQVLDGPESLLDLRAVGAWSVAGAPVVVELALPRDRVLLGHESYLQGALNDASLGAKLPWGLTQALALTIGLP